MLLISITQQSLRFFFYNNYHSCLKVLCQQFKVMIFPNICPYIQVIFLYTNMLWNSIEEYGIYSLNDLNLPDKEHFRCLRVFPFKKKVLSIFIEKQWSNVDEPHAETSRQSSKYTQQTLSDLYTSQTVFWNVINKANWMPTMLAITLAAFCRRWQHTKYLCRLSVGKKSIWLLENCVVYQDILAKMTS